MTPAAAREGSASALPTSAEGHNGTPREELSVGDIVAERDFHLTRDSLVRYAGASGDFNPIHYRDDVAIRVGLPGILAHGMLTMGIAAQPVFDWLGDPGRIVDYQVRFTRPVLVDATDGAHVHVVAKVGAVDAAAGNARANGQSANGQGAGGQGADGHGSARIDLTVTFENATVLGKAQLRIRTGQA